MFVLCYKDWFVVLLRKRGEVMTFIRNVFQLAGLLLFCFGCGISAALAQSELVTSEDIEFFLERSHAGSEQSEDDKDWEDFLFEATKDGDSAGVIVASFAQKTNLDRHSAEIVAAAIIEIVRWDEYCPDKRNDIGYDCKFEPGAQVYDKFLAAQIVDTTGEFAFIVGKNIGSEWDPIEIRRRFLDNVVQHQGRIRTFTRMLDYTRDDLWVFALAAAGEIDAEAAKLIFLRQYYGSIYEASNWNGGSVALIEGLLERRSLDQDTRSLLSLSLVALQTRTGMNEAAVRTYQRLPNVIRSYVPPADAPDAKYSSDRLFENYVGFKIDLASVFFEQGRRSYAQSLLKDAVRQSDNFENVGYSYKVRARALGEIITPKLAKNNVFDYFLYGRLPDEPDPVGEEEYFFGGPGWLFLIENAAPAFRKAAEAYLKERDYEGMAKHLASQPLYHRSDRADTLIDSLLPLLPEKFTVRKGYWSERIDDVWNRHSTNETVSPNATESHHSSSEKPLAHYVRYELPEPFRTTQDEPDFEGRLNPAQIEDTDLPVSEYQVVRYENENGERQLIYLSSALDAPGEIPAYGYWFQQTTDGGKIWQEPLYLGIQQYFPYFVVARSKLPMITGDSLNVEVEAREVDLESITFPPVGLTLKRTDRNLYLSFNFEALRRDTDRDGLTDLVERRLQMDPVSADSDDDGLEDARDPLPLTKFDPNASTADKELAYAILSAIVGYERNAIVVNPRTADEQFDLMDMIGADRPPSISDGAVFLVADPEKYSGIRTPFRLFVFSEEDVKKINAQGAPFYPVGIQSMFRRPDGSEYYVIWSAGWVGGEFVVRCKDEKCETEVISSWIT